MTLNSLPLAVDFDFISLGDILESGLERLFIVMNGFRSCGVVPLASKFTRCGWIKVLYVHGGVFPRRVEDDGTRILHLENS